MEFSRQEYWSGLPFPSPRDLPDPGIKPGSPALQADALPSEPPGKPGRSCPKYFIYFKSFKSYKQASLVTRGKESICQCRRHEDSSLIPGLGRSPGEGKGNPLQYSCLENSMDGEAWWATVHGVTKSRTQLSDFSFLCFLLSKVSIKS